MRSTPYPKRPATAFCSGEAYEICLSHSNAIMPDSHRLFYTARSSRPKTWRERNNHFLTFLSIPTIFSCCQCLAGLRFRRRFRSSKKALSEVLVAQRSCQRTGFPRENVFAPPICQCRRETALQLLTGSDRLCYASLAKMRSRMGLHTVQLALYRKGGV